jgi:hypothetical protein
VDCFWRVPGRSDEPVRRALLALTATAFPTEGQPHCTAGLSLNDSSPGPATS